MTRSPRADLPCEVCTEASVPHSVRRPRRCCADTSSRVSTFTAATSVFLSPRTCGGSSTGLREPSILRGDRNHLAKLAPLTAWEQVRPPLETSWELDPHTGPRSSVATGGARSRHRSHSGCGTPPVSPSLISSRARATGAAMRRSAPGQPLHHHYEISGRAHLPALPGSEREIRRQGAFAEGPLSGGWQVAH